jgi:hypothetical protein
LEIEIADQSTMVSSTTMPVQDDAIANTSHDDNQQGLSSLRRNGPILVKMNFPNKKRKTKKIESTKTGK